MPSNPIELPTGQKFYRRWQVNAFKGQTAVELRFSSSRHLPNTRFTCAVRWRPPRWILSAIPTRCDEHRPTDPDFDSYAMIAKPGKEPEEAGAAELAEVPPFEAAPLRRAAIPMARALPEPWMRFTIPRLWIERVDGRTGAKVIRHLRADGALANLPRSDRCMRLHLRGSGSRDSAHSGAWRHGIHRQGTGAAVDRIGPGVRLLVRSAAGIPEALRASGKLDCRDWRLGKPAGFAASDGGSGVRLPPGAGECEELGGLSDSRLKRRAGWASARWKRA